MDPLDAVGHLAGLQAQTPQSWYTGLWSRLSDFNPAAFGRLLEDRAVVRMALMRSTIHLVTGDDALAFRPLVQSVIERSTRGAFARAWKGLDLDAVAEAAQELLDEAPMTFADLGRQLQERWPEHERLPLGQAARSALALVQVPPRGVWQRSGAVRHTTIEAWLGRSPASVMTVDQLVLRYLAAFGPASVMDIQAWCGLTRLAEVVDRLRKDLLVFANGSGRALFDLPNAPRPGADAVAPVRFLYDYDNLLLSHADRSRFITHNLLEMGWRFDGAQPSCLLVDGKVEATWLIERSRGRAVLTVAPLSTLGPAVRDEISSEGLALLAFAVPDAGTHDIRFVD